FVVMNELGDVDALPERLARFKRSMPLDASRRALARHLLRSSVPGAHMSWQGFSSTFPECVMKVQTLVASLNEYLPALASAARRPALPKKPALGGENPRAQEG